MKKSVSFFNYNKWEKINVEVDIPQQIISLDMMKNHCYKEVLFSILMDREVQKEISYFLEFCYSRTEPFEVKTRKGMSGCETFTLITETGKHFSNIRKRAKIHISCFGKIESIYAMYIGDFLEILAKMDEKLLREILTSKTSHLKKMRSGVISYPKWVKYPPKYVEDIVLKGSIFQLN